MSYINTPPPIFNRCLQKLPAHITQSKDLQHLTCRVCHTTTNLGYEPNFYAFLTDHEHKQTQPAGRSIKPWPGSER